jgi:cysteine synthase A
MSFAQLPRTLLILSIGVAIGVSSSYLISHRSHKRVTREQTDAPLEEDIVDGIEGLVGNTKLVRIRSLSVATGCEILAKAEVPPSPSPLRNILLIG